jgi:hypothetical protein
MMVLRDGLGKYSYRIVLYRGGKKKRHVWYQVRKKKYYSPLALKIKNKEINQRIKVKDGEIMYFFPLSLSLSLSLCFFLYFYIFIFLFI